MMKVMGGGVEKEKKEKQQNAVAKLARRLATKMRAIGLEKMKHAFSRLTKLDQKSPGTLNQQEFYRLVQAMTKNNPTTKKVMDGAWNAVCTMDDQKKNAITFADFQAWCCFQSIGKTDAKKQWHKAIERFKQKSKAINESQRIQQEGEISSIVLHNQMLKRQHIANLRLQKRLNSRNGTTVMPVQQPQYRPIPKYKKKQVTNIFTPTHVLKVAREYHNSEAVKAIQSSTSSGRIGSKRLISKKSIRSQTVDAIQVAHGEHREKALIDINERQRQSKILVQARVLARAQTKEKQGKAAKTSVAGE